MDIFLKLFKLFKMATGIEDDATAIVALMAVTFILTTLVSFCVEVFTNPSLLQNASF